MPDPMRLAKAEIRELKDDFKTETGNKIKVQFNPETLSVHYSNQVVTSNRSGCQTGPQALQYVGAGATSLSVTLWFDVNAPQTEDNAQDVRVVTAKVIQFITPKKQTESANNTPEYIPPGVRFVWGTFLFDGIMTDLQESLEFFSSEGRPLRASLTFSLVRQEIYTDTNKENVPFGSQGPLGPGAGTIPLIQATAGASLQQIVDHLNPGQSWQAIASLNNIENPRILKPGLSLRVNIR